MGLSHSPRIVTDGLVFCVDAGDKMSYPGAGTTWTDLSKNRNNGTLVNGPTFDSANGGSIVFDGTNDRVDCGNSTSLNFGNSSSDFPFSIVSWAKFDSFSSTNPIFARGEGDGTTNGIEYTLTIGSDSKAKLILYDNSGGNQIRATTNTTLVTDIWYHICSTYDGSANNTGMKIYINGVPQGITLSTQGTYVAMHNAGQSNYIGSFLRTDPVWYSYMNGNVSLIQIYNRELSAIEVQQNYNATRGRFQ